MPRLNPPNQNYWQSGFVLEEERFLAKMMGVFNVQKDILAMDSTEKISLREERQRTGRYMAAGVAIFLSLLGVYQAVVRGTPEYAALFAPALIMFIYILWILYVSKHQRKMQQDLENICANEETPAVNVSDTIVLEESHEILEEEAPRRHKIIYNRSYSVS